MSVQLRVLAIGLMMALVMGAAKAETFNSWATEVDRGYVEAFTGNDSGSTFGLLCVGKESCLFYIMNDTTCENGAIFPILVNAPAGSAYILGKCAVLRDDGDVRHVFVMDDEKGAFTESIKRGGEIGFAMPLESGRFQVSRFSLNGSLQAIRFVLNSRSMGNGRHTGLKDETL